MNYITVTCYDKNRNPGTLTPLTFTTAFLPGDFPVNTVRTNKPDEMEPGFTLFLIKSTADTSGTYLTMMDNFGQVVWYRRWSSLDYDVRQIGNGDLFIQQASPSNNFVELDLLGNTVRTWVAPTNFPVNDHEGLPTEHGTILYLSDISRTVSNFPANNLSNPPLVTKTVDDNPMVEISASNSVLLNSWSPLAVLDPTRITYLTYAGGSSGQVDNEHANAIIEDTNDDSLIVSLRNQNAVYKISRATGKLVWILGSPENWAASWQPFLLTPVGAPFDWNYGQHAPSLTPQHTLLLYNDGNYRADPPNSIVTDQFNYSSAEEFAIDETNLTVSEVWNSAWQTNQDRLYTGAVGMAQWLPETGNILVTYGTISYVNGAAPNPANISDYMVRIEEYTHDPVPGVVFDLSFFSTNSAGYLCYRSRRIPDLYTHPAAPVVDMNIQPGAGMQTLHFTADPACTYQIQASPDLINWTNMGMPLTGGTTGNFDFPDSSPEVATHFYRILTY